MMEVVSGVLNWNILSITIISDRYNYLTSFMASHRGLFWHLPQNPLWFQRLAPTAHVVILYYWCVSGCCTYSPTPRSVYK